MKTEIVTSASDKLNRVLLERAGKVIRDGGLVAFPTETVYGLGGDALNPESSRKIYAAKGRPSDNPLIVHICDVNDLRKIVRKVSGDALRLADRFWPGPLTMILPKADIVPKETTGGLDTVAIRFPSHPVAREFIKAAGGFVAAPSANLSGRPSPAKAKYVIEDMDGRIDMIIDGGDVGIGLESTIVDLSGSVPMLLRPGYITLEMLKEILPSIEVDKTILDGNCTDKPKAPGMKYRHYAPKGKLTIIEGDESDVIRTINELSCAAMKSGEKVGVIATHASFGKYKADVVKDAGSRDNEEEIAGNLYNILREFDDEEMTVMFSESFETGGLGQAIMNRLLKAAGHDVIKV